MSALQMIVIANLGARQNWQSEWRDLDQYAREQGLRRK
jgi:hypothetical protein